MKQKDIYNPEKIIDFEHDFNKGQEFSTPNYLFGNIYIENSIRNAPIKILWKTFVPKNANLLCDFGWPMGKMFALPRNIIRKYVGYKVVKRPSGLRYIKIETAIKL